MQLLIQILEAQAPLTLTELITEIVLTAGT